MSQFWFFEKAAAQFLHNGEGFLMGWLVLFQLSHFGEKYCISSERTEVLLTEMLN